MSPAKVLGEAHSQPGSCTPGTYKDVPGTVDFPSSPRLAEGYMQVRSVVTADAPISPSVPLMACCTTVLEAPVGEKTKYRRTLHPS